MTFQDVVPNPLTETAVKVLSYHLYMYTILGNEMHSLCYSAPTDD